MTCPAWNHAHQYLPNNRPSQKWISSILTIGTHATQKKMHPDNAQEFFQIDLAPHPRQLIITSALHQLRTQILPAQITWILTNRLWSWVILTMRRTGSALPVYLTNVHICCSTWARFCQRNIKSLAPYRTLAQDNAKFKYTIQEEMGKSNGDETNEEGGKGGSMGG
jgi:hypothetical protein